MAQDLFVKVFNGNCSEKKAALSMKDSEGRTLKISIEGEVKDDSPETIRAAVRKGVKVSLSKKLAAKKTFSRSGEADGDGAANLADFILTDGALIKVVVPQGGTGELPDSRGVDAALDQLGVGAGQVIERVAPEAAPAKPAKSRNGQPA